VAGLRRFVRIALVRGIVLGIGVGTLGTVGPPPAWASEEGTPKAEVVVLEIAVSDARESDAVAQVVRELLGRLAVDVRATQVARIDVAAIAAPPRVDGAGEPPLARVWIDWRTAGRATLYLLDARHDRLLVRQVERPAGGEELAREELAHILETACEGLLAGGEIGLPRAGVVPLLMPPPVRAPVVVAASSPPPGVADAAARAEVAVLYEAATLAPEAPLTHGPTVSVFVRASVRGLRWGLWSTAQLRMPVHAAAENAGVSLQTGALRALLAVERSLSWRATVRGGLGGGVDLVHATPETGASDQVVLDRSRTLAFAVGRAAVAIDLRMSARTSFTGTIATDVDLTGQRYVFVRGGAEQLVLRPWAVRPAAAIGFAFP
jgi:hypothetical protein